MTISWLQAIILGIFACLSSMPGMGGTTIGNYTLGRPLVAGLVCGIVLGDIQAGVSLIPSSHLMEKLYQQTFVPYLISVFHWQC